MSYYSSLAHSFLFSVPHPKLLFKLCTVLGRQTVISGLVVAVWHRDRIIETMEVHFKGFGDAPLISRPRVMDS